MLIDTHCHIHDRDTYNFALSRQQLSEKYLKKHPEVPHLPADFEPSKIIERAHFAGVSQMICVGTSHEDSLIARDFATSHASDGVFWSYGIHPDEADKWASQDISHSDPPRPTGSGRSEGSPVTTDRAERVAREMFDSSILVAIGEVGLDYREGAPREGVAGKNNQIKLFEEMLQLAKDQNLPLIFHVRDAFDDFFAVVKNFPEVKGVVHSFSDSPENLKKSLNFGFFIGANGLATFIKPELPLPPLERMLLETDAPFLTPAPFRGTINEPAHVRDICAYISDTLGIPEAEIEGRTTENARNLFKLTH